MRSLPIILLITNILSAAITTTTATSSEASFNDPISISKLSKHERDLSRDAFLPTEKNVEDITLTPTASPTYTPTYTPTKSPIVLAIEEPGPGIDTDNGAGGIGTDRPSTRANGSISAAPFIAIGAVAFVIAGAYLQRKYKGGGANPDVQNDVSDDDDQDYL